MGKQYSQLPDNLTDFIARQKIFFVGTAAADGRVNVSPKGMDTLRVVAANRVVWLNLTGSGNETAAHLRENGRIVLMFNAFSGPPKIVRFHGQGRVLAEDSPEFAALLPSLSLPPESRRLVRGIVVVDVERISDSCGFGVPRMDLVAERDQLQRWSETQEAKHGETWKTRYMREKNTRSIDGMPGYDLGKPW